MNMKDALREKKVDSALLADDVSMDTTDEWLFLIISALDEKPLRAVRHCTTTKDACDKLQTRYASKTFMTILGVLKSLLNIRLKRGEQLDDHIARMGTKFVRLASMDDLLPRSVQMGLLVSSLSNLAEYSATMASINTRAEGEMNCIYCSMILLQ